MARIPNHLLPRDAKSRKALEAIQRQASVPVVSSPTPQRGSGGIVAVNVPIEQVPMDALAQHGKGVNVRGNPDEVAPIPVGNPNVVDLNRRRR